MCFIVQVLCICMIKKLNKNLFLIYFLYLMSISKVVTVIPTFFTPSGVIDYPMVCAHINRQILNNIKSIVILGTTSEAPTLSQHERIVFAHHIFKTFSDKLNITVGLGGNNTAEMIEEIKQLDDISHNIMISQPAYNKPTQEGIYQHFKALIDASTKPIIIYNIPSRCGVNIEPTTVQRIGTYSYRVVGIKEASGNLDQIMTIKDICPNLLIWSGDDNLVLPVLSVGGYGVISVVSNVVPRLMGNIVFAFESGNVKSAYELFYTIKSLIKMCFIESNPVPVKYILSLEKNEPTMEYVRLPLVTLSDQSKEIIKICVKNMKNFQNSEEQFA